MLLISGTSYQYEQHAENERRKNRMIAKKKRAKREKEEVEKS